MSKSRGGKRLGKDISSVVSPMNMGQDQIAVFHMLTQWMPMDIDMFSVGMKNLVIGEIDGTIIVT